MQTTEQRKAKARKAAARSAAIRTVWTPEKEAFLRENHGTMTLVALSRHMRIADTTIRKKMRAWGISRKRRTEMNIPKSKQGNYKLILRARSESDLFLARRSEQPALRIARIGYEFGVAA